MKFFKYLGHSVCAAVLGLTAGQGAAGPDTDWPCEQALVPEVPAAAVWDGPALDGIGSAWRDDPAVAALVQRIAGPRVTESEAERAIESFASGLESGSRDRMLALAFAGVLDTLNRDRNTLISGIKRYSRDQQRRAEVLGKELDEMVRLEQDPSESAAGQLAALSQRLELEQRMFDEREKTIPYLCTRPIAVEQRIGFLARTLAVYLD